jgi:hypothetical protein
MPAYNNIRLPLDNYPNSVTQSVQRPEDLWSTHLPLSRRFIYCSMTRRIIHLLCERHRRTCVCVRARARV